MLPSFGLSVTGRNSGKFGEAQDQCFLGLKTSHRGFFKCGDFPNLSQWTSQGLHPPRSRLLRLRVASERSLGREEQGQAQELSLKDKEILAGMNSKKMKTRGWEGLLGLGRTTVSLPTVRAASISS